ncbi:MAG: hypothetical protein KDK04_07685 [Candidatus Competibacteraceae bacterium]|nr:hypothetical protein [Candidatus Competibacteraceae bacterium]MCB1807020.1 hypothetical protein [Candidatus Competibacteraceae bacterium]MCB1811587.1 hypothetical protein [Candidatus Competibacteraceae bacterium]
MARADFGFSGFLWRFIPALALVFLTYNPLKWSYFHWVMQPEGDSIPLKVLVGIILLIGYGVYLTATFKSMGPIGVIIVIVFFLVLLWVFYSYGWLQINDPSEFAWVALIIIALTLAIGMSWSGFWRRMTGQVTTDSVDDDPHD